MISKMGHSCCAEKGIALGSFVHCNPICTPYNLTFFFLLFPQQQTTATSSLVLLEPDQLWLPVSRALQVLESHLHRFHQVCLNFSTLQRAGFEVLQGRGEF